MRARYKTRNKVLHIEQSSQVVAPRNGTQLSCPHRVACLLPAEPVLGAAAAAASPATPTAAAVGLQLSASTSGAALAHLWRATAAAAATAAV